MKVHVLGFLKDWRRGPAEAPDSYLRNRFFRRGRQALSQIISASALTLPPSESDLIMRSPLPRIPVSRFLSASGRGGMSQELETGAANPVLKIGLNQISTRKMDARERRVFMPPKILKPVIFRHGISAVLERGLHHRRVGKGRQTDGRGPLLCPRATALPNCFGFKPLRSKVD